MTSSEQVQDHEVQSQFSTFTGLRRLIESGETAHIKLALQILNSMAIPSDLWTLLFGIWAFHPESEVQKQAFDLYDRHTSIHWPRSYRFFDRYDEQDTSLFLEELTSKYPLNAKDLCKISLILHRTGAKFCLEKAILPAEEVFRKICEYDSLDLSNFQLKTLSPEIGKLTHLNTLNLSKNLFEDIPDEIGLLTRLEYLYIDLTPLNPVSEQKLERFFPKIFAPRWFSKSVHYFYEEDYEKALDALDRAIKLDSTNANYWNTKGVLLGRLGKSEMGLLCFHESLNINPEKALIYSNYANALHELGRNRESLEIAQKGIDVLDKNTQLDRECYGMLYFRKGQALFHLNNIKESIQAYEKAIQANPEDGCSWYNQACNYAYLNDTDQAIQHIKRAVALDSSLKSEALQNSDFSALLNNLDFQMVIFEK